MATHLEKVRESERTNIAREIRDELGQQQTGLKMDISWLKRKIKSEDTAVQSKIAETIALIDTTVNLFEESLPRTTQHPRRLGPRCCHGMVE